MKKNFEIFDCTLRDGGFYTNWEYSDDFLKEYANIIKNIGVSNVEIGYLNPKQTSYKGEFFYLHKKTIAYMRSLIGKNIKIWAMIDLKYINNISFLEKTLVEHHYEIDGIRLTVPFEHSRKKLKDCIELINKFNIKSAANLMYGHKYIGYQKKLFEVIEECADVNILSLVDSYGVITPNNTKLLMEDLIKYKKNFELGFHGHNNLELGFANALIAHECGAGYLDSTIQGFGRGAGNVRTELLVLYKSLNSKTKTKSLITQSICEIDNFILPMKKKYTWGPNIPYALGAANKLPQSLVMDLLDLKRLNSIDLIDLANKNKFPEKINKKFFKLKKFTKEYNNAAMFISDSKKNILTERELDITVKKWPVNKIIFLGLNSLNRHFSLISNLKPKYLKKVVIVSEGSSKLENLLLKLNLPNLRVLLTTNFYFKNIKSKKIKINFTLNNPLESFFYLNNLKKIDLVILRGLDGGNTELDNETIKLIKKFNANSDVISTTATNYPVLEISAFI